MSLVSVVVPVYNAGAYLEACLTAILAQSHEALEVILVDDGSTDDSGARCDAWAQKDGRVRVVHTPNQGVSGARNLGVTQATGAYLAFVDADDLLPSDALERLLSAAAGMDIVGSLYETFTQDGDRRVYLPEVGVTKRSRVLAHLVEGDVVFNTACAKLYRRTFWVEKGLGFPQGMRIGEDALLNLKAYALAGQVTQVMAVTYRYRLHPASAMHRAEGEYERNLPWLRGVRDNLDVLGLRQSLQGRLCLSFALRYYKQQGLKGLLVDFNRVLRPEVLRGLPPQGLGLFGRLVKAGAFPVLCGACFPFWRVWVGLKEMRGRRAACRW